MAVEMDIKSVKSRDIALVGYDPSTATLEIVFRMGGVYRYHEVPESVYHSLMSAPSHGTYFQKNVKNKFAYVKVS
ncbi:MAG TPA: KTSC domain-containing protein [Candidatus Omnitrophota bacterium]|nr:KTSC domain-containing protein [Candidatus Omnitrophota bacterium]HPS36936.1 KTSC domain-containing protein [Candidatus Omnitrophota bacterium]